MARPKTHNRDPRAAELRKREPRQVIQTVRPRCRVCGSDGLVIDGGSHANAKGVRFSYGSCRNCGGRFVLLSR